MSKKKEINPIVGMYVVRHIQSNGPIGFPAYARNNKDAKAMWSVLANADKKENKNYLNMMPDQLEIIKIGTYNAKTHEVKKVKIEVITKVKDLIKKGKK